MDFIKRLDKSKIRDQIGKIENQINLKPEKITDIAIDLDLPSFLALVNSQFIRGILPVDANSRKAQVSNKILESAKTNGSTNFIITIREPLPAKNTTPNEQRTRLETNKKIITDILKQSGDIRLLQEFPDFNSFLVEATYDQLNRLSISQDSRVSAILENTVIASTGLITSVPTINAPPVWSYGYTGAGQGLIIIDTGVDLNHPWLSGNVVSLACFGTTGPDTYGALYTSYCPGASASTNWDSPSTESNPAGPLGGPSGVDSHGTHVAGIAASHDGMFRGVAPGATIYSVVAASRGNSNNAPVFLASDLLAAYQAIVLAAPYTPGYNQPYTINLSIWSNATIYSTPCTSSVVPEYQATLIAYQKMKDAGIPIVTITGNAGWKAGIAWPACAPNTIKVSSTKNDVIGNTLSSFANVVNPLNYPLEALWLAPGGGDGTSITSAVPGAAGGQKMGTSMAAPHVAGAYALAKNVDPTVTVDGWNSWFKFNASVPVNVQVSSFEQGPQTTVQWRRLRFPY